MKATTIIACGEKCRTIYRGYKVLHTSKFLPKSCFCGDFFFKGFHCRERGRLGFFSLIKSKFFYGINVRGFCLPSMKMQQFLLFLE